MAISKKSVTTGTDNGTSATVSVTTSESPTATAVGDLVVVVHGNDFYALSNMPTPTATGSPTLNAITDTGVPVDAGSNNAHIKGYWYVANTAGAQTITVTETGSHDEEKSITAFVLGGADTVTAIDDAAGNFATATSQVANGITAGPADDFLCIVVNSGTGSATASYTTPAPLTEEHEWHVGGYSGVVATTQLSASGATGNFTFTAANSIPYGAITIAVLTASPAGGSALRFAPGKTWRRRYKHRQLLPGGAIGPTAFAQTATDDAGATDSATAAAAYVRAQTDDSGSTDTATRVAASAQTATDTAGLTDTESQAAGYARTNTDLAGTVDSTTQAAAFAQAPTDTAGLTDTASQVTASVRSPTDDTGLTDSMSQSSSGAGAQTFTDSAGLTDSTAQAVTYSITITDSAGVTDVKAGSLSRLLTDQASPTDAITRLAAFAPSVTDPAGLTDGFTQASVTSYVYIFIDSAGLTDVFTQPTAPPTGLIGSLGNIGHGPEVGAVTYETPGQAGGGTGMTQGQDVGAVTYDPSRHMLGGIE